MIFSRTLRHSIAGLVIILFILFAIETRAQNTNIEFKVEEGESASDGDPDRPLIQGSLPNTDSTRIPKEVQTSEVNPPSDIDDTDENTNQNNQTDLDYLNERARIQVKAVDVRGWDSIKKDTLLTDVKDFTEVRTNEDLENFAAALLIQDENIESIDISSSQTKITYRLPAKLLGIFGTRITTDVTVNEDDSDDPETFGQVKVKFPWYRFLFSMSQDLRAKVLEADLAGELRDVKKQNNDLQSTLGKRTQMLNAMISSLKKTTDIFLK